MANVNRIPYITSSVDVTFWHKLWGFLFVSFVKQGRDKALGMAVCTMQLYVHICACGDLGGIMAGCRHIKALTSDLHLLYLRCWQSGKGMPHVTRKSHFTLYVSTFLWCLLNSLHAILQRPFWHRSQKSSHLSRVKHRVQNSTVFTPSNFYGKSQKNFKRQIIKCDATAAGTLKRRAKYAAVFER